MSGGEWAHLIPVPGGLDTEQARAEAAFRKAHPGAEVGPAGKLYAGYVPYTVDGVPCSITMTGKTWRAVLDSLEEYFREDQPDTG
jgi:hypothetical protein